MLLLRDKVKLMLDSTPYCGKAITWQKAKKGPQRKNVRAITVKPLTMSYAAQIYKYLIKFIFLIKLIKLILR